MRKLNKIKVEIDCTLTILGIIELRWTGIGSFQSEGYNVYYSGYETHTQKSLLS